MEAAATAEAREQTDGPERLLKRLQELQAQLDAAPESGTREVADELVSAVVQMYGTGLERIVGHLMEAGAEGERLATELADDPLICTLLLIHDLHPVPLADRVGAALAKVAPYMESHGGGVELLSLHDGVARIRLQGSCSDCQASSATLELAVKQALEELAPDLEGLEVEGVAPQMTGLALPMLEGASTPMANGELPIVNVGVPAAPERAPISIPAWTELEGMQEPQDGTMVTVATDSGRLLLASVDGTLLAYQDACTACGAALHEGELRSGALRCAGCSRSFFLPRAGRSMDDEAIQLDPVPLLREQGAIKVALAS